MYSLNKTYNNCSSLIIDDDSGCRKVLTRMLQKYPEVDVVGEAECINSALDILKSEEPDSVFLDIKLKNENAFDLVNQIPEKTRVIFVSGYEKYALKAFEINAFDYIKKPFNAERLDQTVKKLISDLKLHREDKYSLINHENHSEELILEHSGNGHNGNGHNGNGHNGNGHNGNGHYGFKYGSSVIINLSEEDDDEMADGKEHEMSGRNHNGNKNLEYDDRIFITTENISRFLKISQILCITAEKDYTYIITPGGKKFLVLKSMAEWEERLTPKYFVRIHRSSIVNLEYVEKVERWFNYSYQVYVNGIAEPFQMSRRYSSRLKERFK
jgi:DNA-binding LytR/AlgR family response regulator